MGQIKFYAFGYWDKQTMKLGDSPSQANLQKVTNLCQQLTAKYSFDEGCKRHPDQEQVIWVNFFNGYIDFSISPNDTCRCMDMLQRLSEISFHEESLNNG